MADHVFLVHVDNFSPFARQCFVSRVFAKSTQGTGYSEEFPPKLSLDRWLSFLQPTIDSSQLPEVEYSISSVV